MLKVINWQNWRIVDSWHVYCIYCLPACCTYTKCVMHACQHYLHVYSVKFIDVYLIIYVRRRYMVSIWMLVEMGYHVNWSQIFFFFTHLCRHPCKLHRWLHVFFTPMASCVLSHVWRLYCLLFLVTSYTVKKEINIYYSNAASIIMMTIWVHIGIQYTHNVKSVL